MLSITAAEFTGTSHRPVHFSVRVMPGGLFWSFSEGHLELTRTTEVVQEGVKGMASIWKLRSCAITMNLPNKDLSGFKIINRLFVLQLFLLVHVAECL